MIDVVRLLALTVLTAGVAACDSPSQAAPASPASAAARPCGGPAPGAVTVAAASHVMTVVVGPVEQMYSQEQVTATHPTSGEVMLGGEMAMPPSTTAAGSSNLVRHLEVHICTASGGVISDAHPTIRLRDATTGKAETVPVAVMEGVTAGASDLHYGNNITVQAGDAYVVDVSLDGSTTTIHLPSS